MSLSKIPIKEQYRSDRDHIVNDFFHPCLAKSIEYNRCVEFLSIATLSTILSVHDHFTNGKAKLRMITGHRFKAVDLDLLSAIFSDTRNPLEKRRLNNSNVGELHTAFKKGVIELKVASSIEGTTTHAFEKIGIFKDQYGQGVAFVGTSRDSFLSENKKFESIDVFTSWDDASRVDRKIKDFENLWDNKINYMEVHDFKEAYDLGLLKYWTEWATPD